MSGNTERGMTINALRGRSNTGDTRPETPAIGEDDANIVDCPACKRPLDAASRRCPGCGTLLIAGVQASKGFLFSAFGAAIGLMVGASVMGVATLGARPEVTSPSTPIASNPPVATTAPMATVAPGGGGTGSPLVPVAATAALKGTAAVNARIASTAAPLSAALATPDFDSQGVAQILRRLNVEAGAAQALLPALNSWDTASAIHGQLRDFYESLRATANLALSASIRNDEAYKAAARDVLQQLATLPSITSASRDLAQTAGVELPAVDTP
jgi:hypothetical protein